MVTSTVADPVLSADLLERVLARLGVAARPSLDLAGLNTLYAAYCGSVPAIDTIRKRVWFAGGRTTPLPGGEPRDYLEHWLAHGTGGTCWPTNGAVYALVRSLGFDARRIAGSIIVEGYLQGANHGSVLVTLDGVDYLVDGNFGSFTALPVLPGKTTSTGEGLHDISAVPIEAGFDVRWYQGHSREEPLTLRTEPQHDPVDHGFFLRRYDMTKSKSRGLFNYALFICRRFPDSIITLGRKNKITVAADNTVTSTEVSESDRKGVLVEEFGISEEMADALPPDEPDAVALL